jgi:hypothetical protein
MGAVALGLPSSATGLTVRVTQMNPNTWLVSNPSHWVELASTAPRTTEPRVFCTSALGIVRTLSRRLEMEVTRRKSSRPSSIDPTMTTAAYPGSRAIAPAEAMTAGPAIAISSPGQNPWLSLD